MTASSSRLVGVGGRKGLYTDLVERVHPCLRDHPKSRHCRLGTSSTYSSPLVTQLHDQLQTTQNELHTTQAHLHLTKEEMRTTREELDATRKQLNKQRIILLEFNARFDSFSMLLGHPMLADNSQQFSWDLCTVLTPSLW